MLGLLTLRSHNRTLTQRLTDPMRFLLRVQMEHSCGSHNPFKVASHIHNMKNASHMGQNGTMLLIYAVTFSRESANFVEQENLVELLAQGTHLLDDSLQKNIRCCMGHGAAAIAHVLTEKLQAVGKIRRRSVWECHGASSIGGSESISTHGGGSTSHVGTCDGTPSADERVERNANMRDASPPLAHESRSTTPMNNLMQPTILESIRIQDLQNAQYILGRSILCSGYPLSMVDNEDTRDAWASTLR